MKKEFTPYQRFVELSNRRVFSALFLALIFGILSYVPSYAASAAEASKKTYYSTTKSPVAFAGEKITSFTLINADTEQPIQTIANGATLNLATLPTKNLNIRADTYPTTVGSVVFTLSGAQIRNETQTGKPYALFGDAGGNYNPWIPTLGTYTLKCTPYSASAGSGTAGTSLTITFTVVNKSSTSLISNIKSYTGKSYAQANLSVGTVFYTDRTYKITSLPASLNGEAFIKTPNDDKYYTGTRAFTFQLGQSSTVYIAYDPLATKLPSWMTGWQKTFDRIGINDPRISYLEVYSKTFAPGTITIGGNLASPAVGSKNTYIVVVKPSGVTNVRPYVTAVRPADEATNVPLDQSISVDLKYPGGNSINGSTVTPSTVKLYTVSSTGTKTQVSGTAVNSTAAGDAITLSAALKASTTYEFQITDGVKDDNGNALVPFASRFTTTGVAPENPGDLSGVSFTEQTLITTSFGADGFTSLVVGPDHRLYATTSGGKIERWDIRADGTITNHIRISPFGTNRRLLIGMRFAPSSTSSNLIAWISHSSPVFTNAPDWSGKISRINLNNTSSPQVVDYVINLPRSYKDHSTNSIDFGPDGALYFPQGSNSAMGSLDGAWGNRAERLLNAAILRLDINKAQQQGLPIDVKTQEGGTYNPAATNAPLTIYATGIRNAYDLVWHSNGSLYVPTNGSAAGGNTPALPSGTVWSNGQKYTGASIAAMNDVRQTQNDYLFRVVKGGYYGHPNVLRNEYIMNGGNPTSNTDPGELVGYPVGTPKEPNYRGFIYNFGLNISPNGAIEYKSNAFGGKLKGKMLVCRFSGGDDLIVLAPSSTN
ncbi:MAG: Ig-like domain-containing protein, partial [Bacteroidota bacterium]|nr:Ig-like domain-containing protein [Bacteroidota bacterium]